MTAIILAGGIGKRFLSSLPKPLHLLLGKPLIFYPIFLLKEITQIERIIIVVNYQFKDLYKQILKDVEIVYQKEPKGTADAVKAALEIIKSEDVLILPSDMPLVERESIQELLDIHKDSDLSLLVAEVKQPQGLGRIIKDQENNIKEIKEESELDEKEKQDLRVVNVGVYCVKTNFLKEAIDMINCDNKQKEYYLTDIVKIGYLKNKKIKTKELKEYEALGINTREELWRVGQILLDKKIKELQKKGVTFINPSCCYLEQVEIVEIQEDTIIYPFVTLCGQVSIGKRCKIGPFTYIEDCQIGNEVEIISSVIKKSLIKDRVKIGPYCHIRQDVIVKEGVKLGNFVELKKAVIEEATKIMHLAYIGDSKIGKKVNIGAGTIICNFDGVRKHETIIEEGAFIGSNSSLIAPIKVGKFAFVAAGSVVTCDVPPFALAVGRVKQKNVENWVKTKGLFNDIL